MRNISLRDNFVNKQYKQVKLSRGSQAELERVTNLNVLFTKLFRVHFDNLG